MPLSFSEVSKQLNQHFKTTTTTVNYTTPQPLDYSQLIKERYERYKNLDHEDYEFENDDSANIGEYQVYRNEDSESEDENCVYNKNKNENAEPENTNSSLEQAIDFALSSNNDQYCSLNELCSEMAEIRSLENAIEQDFPNAVVVQDEGQIVPEMQETFVQDESQVLLETETQETQ